ncbi:MAG: hypothetical protein A2506_13035 [Elusimicrobia bacterium RIFOXYD12_FULL_66_9]|nr:MAG: hypothetical protein A2506_13035 [Elusimicrobia bacterium RIFOXYD12_FULL_66_9]
MVVILLGLAAFFWIDPVGMAPALDDIPPNKPEFSSTDTVRKVRTEMTFDGAPCSSCHEGTEPLQGNPVEKGSFHDKIELKHGRNRHCFNCHHRLQPANFSDYDGTPIKLADIQLLCAKCHGTTYRDWNNGAHGRRSGYWDASKGKFKTVVCIACHNPHWPIFKPMEAAAAPHVNPRTRTGVGAGSRHEAAPEPAEGGHH